MTIDNEPQGLSTCPECGKVFLGTGAVELCFACYLMHNPPEKYEVEEQLPDAGAESK